MTRSYTVLVDEGQPVLLRALLAPSATTPGRVRVVLVATHPTQPHKQLALCAPFRLEMS